MTEEEKQEIINRTAEKVLLSIPEVLGNLMTQHAMLRNMNETFYRENPDMKDHKDVVVSVVEKIEGGNPLAKYEDILKQAVPEIRQRILTMKSLDMKNTVRPNSFSFGQKES